MTKNYFILEEGIETIDDLKSRYSFDFYVRNVIVPIVQNKQYYFLYQNQLVPQYLYAFDKKRNKIVDFIGKVENIKEDFNEVADILELESSVMDKIHINKTQRDSQDYRDYYTEETKQIIEKVYQTDMQAFGYKY